MEEKDIKEISLKISEMRSDYYWEIYSRLSGYQKKTLNALYHSDKNIFSKSFAKKYGLNQASSTQRAVKYLITNGIIYKTKDLYQFSDPFFKIFISRYAD